MQRRMTVIIVMLTSIGGSNFDGLSWDGRAWASGDGERVRQFSAGFLTSKPSGDAVGAPGKIYVDASKVRIETSDLPDSYFLIDGGVPTAYLVRPQARVFMDAKQSSQLTRLFLPLVDDDPCPQWETMAEVAGIPNQSGHWSCKAVGQETVEGRSTVKFEATSPRGVSAGWIDTELKFPLKIETEDGTVFALRNIQEGPQPADLFVVPASYKKFDPRLLIERLKHSDVLVEPTN